MRLTDIVLIGAGLLVLSTFSKSASSLPMGNTAPVSNSAPSQHLQSTSETIVAKAVAPYSRSELKSMINTAFGERVDLERYFKSVKLSGTDIQSLPNYFQLKQQYGYWREQEKTARGLLREWY